MVFSQLDGAGPAAAQFIGMTPTDGLTTMLCDPLTGGLGQRECLLRDHDGRVIAENNDWQTGGGFPAPAPAELATAAASVGAFPFSPGSRDAAVVVTLPPGAYTAVVTGHDAQAGVALLELYELGP